jgi:hypothetical protein
VCPSPLSGPHPSPLQVLSEARYSISYLRSVVLWTGVGKRFYFFDDFFASFIKGYTYSRKKSGHNFIGSMNLFESKILIQTEQRTHHDIPTIP